MRVLGISGSLRAGSYNSLILNSLPQLAPEGMKIENYDGLSSLPPYNEDLDTSTPPDEVARLRAAVQSADGLVWVIPEFNHSVPGVVKNAIDWLSHPISRAVLRGATSAVIVATRGRGGFRGMADLTRILRDLGGFVVPAPEVCVQFVDTRISTTEAGDIRYADPATEGLIKVLLASLARAADAGLGEHAGRAWLDTLHYLQGRGGAR
ncbi:NADPH-dependent FMN reductase [Streptomyces sp. 5K101]|uniref:NADPH-dependent FMN reductase n=1 Tax=Streptomyces sp. 5K101 TaxID=3390037 RepID=UPI003976583B